MSLISIIVPCYNEEQVLPETLRRLGAFAAAMRDVDFEFLFVDDGSGDDTYAMLKKAAADDPRFRIIKFARNFGHQTAITAGIDVAAGDGVVVIDADLQDPPEVIGEMIAKWREGFDVVYAERAERLGESWFKRATACAFYKFINYLSDISIPLNVGDFRFMSRDAVEALKAMPERDRFVRGMVSWVGFRQTAVRYTRDKRFAGTTKYPLRKMIRFAMDGVMSFSVKPLQLSALFATTCAGIAVLILLYAVALRLFSNVWVPGWAATIVATLFLGAAQLICIGVVGEYIGRIYMEAKRRPLYIVSEYVGFAGDALADSRSPVRRES